MSGGVYEEGTGQRAARVEAGLTTHQSRVSTKSKSRSNADRWFYVIVTMFVILVNVVAFSPSLLNPSTRTATLPLTFIVVTWLVLVEGARRGFDLSGDLVRRGTSMDPGTFLAPS